MVERRHTMMRQRHTDRTPEAARETWQFPMLPIWRSFDDLFRDGLGRKVVAVEEFTEDGMFVVRAELPGLDPEKDVEITVLDGLLTISAERTEKEETSERHFQRRELRYGSFVRSVAIPDNVDAEKVTASYKDGILEVRVPLPEGKPAEVSRHVPVTRG
jgi:HSP20 family protein